MITIFKTRNSSLQFFFILLFTLAQFLQLAFGQITEKQPLRRRMTPGFVPFELINVTTRWTHRRWYGSNDQLEQYVTNNADQYWSAMNKAFNDYVQQRSKDIKRQWGKTVAKSDLVKGGQVSQKCLDVLEFMINQPMETEWSAKIIDSIGSLPIGLLSNTMVELGDFDQCLSVDGQFEETPFVGKYCLATVNIPRKSYQPRTYNTSVLGSKWKVDAVELWHQMDNMYALSSAVCFPSICKENEIKAVMRSYYEILQSLEFNVTYCQSRDEQRQYNPKIWIAVTILTIPMSLVLLSLIADLCCISTTDSKTCQISSSLSICQQILNCFSPITNTQRLVRIEDTTATNSSKDINIELQSGKHKFFFLHGIRVISSVMIVIAHSYSLITGSMVTVLPFARYITNYRENIRKFIYHPISNSGLLVHTFFLVSGLLLTYKGLSKRKVKVGYLPFVLFRWLRYSPLLVGSLALTVTLELFGSGPLFHPDHLILNLGSCYEHWWTNLAFVQNFLPLDAQCNISSWYLAAEMQIHLIAYVLLVTYAWKGSKLAYIISGFFIVLQLVAQAGVLLSGLARPAMFQHYPFTQDIYPEFTFNNRVLYMFTFNALVPYFVGAIIGQMLLEGVVVKLSPRLSKLFWTTAVIVTVFFFTNTYFLVQGPEEEFVIFLPGTLTTAVTIFSLTLTWNLVSGCVIYQCAICPTNALARFLSAQIFQPFSRLSFCLNLGHLMIIGYNVLQTRTTVSLSTNSMLQQASSALVLSYLVAYYLYLTWEAPFTNLVKLLWTSRWKETYSDEQTVEINKKKTH